MSPQPSCCSRAIARRIGCSWLGPPPTRFAIGPRRGLIAAMLAAVAVALAASRYLRRHLDAAAMMRCLGAPQRQMLALFALQFLALGLAASVVGCVVALGGQQLLVTLLGTMVSSHLPPPGLFP